jgi:hypothetical protein
VPGRVAELVEVERRIWLGHMLYRICPGIVRYLCPIF